MIAKVCGTMFNVLNTSIGPGSKDYESSIRNYNIDIFEANTFFTFFAKFLKLFENYTLNE